MKKYLLPILYFLFLSIPLLTQERQEETLALKTDESIVIDGTLNESIWGKAPDARTFIQDPLYREDPRKINTEVKILYDESQIYFGILCYDDEPDKIEIGTKKVDQDLRDADSIYVLIDSFVGSYNFFYFGTDIAGSRSDGTISRGRRQVNYNWNGTWKTASQKTDFGWSTEISIDLSCLAKESEKLNSMGLSLARVVPRLDISVYETDPLESAFYMDELGVQKILELFSSDKQIDTEIQFDKQLGLDKKAGITSHIITKVESGNENNLGAGIDAFYAFSPQMLGQLTIYPDFATVEPDHELVNLTPFELYLPERRSFFQNDLDIYQQPLGLFYSKRIGDIYGGLKLNQKSGGSEFSFISAQTKKK
ncbi:DUF5916 domain-containing protein [Acidobacteriota bacterium]